jgi:predicted transcriptional regulator of viral defense system
MLEVFKLSSALRRREVLVETLRGVAVDRRPDAKKDEYCGGTEEQAIALHATECWMRRKLRALVRWIDRGQQT